jgi:hypothetical protein
MNFFKVNYQSITGAVELGGGGFPAGISFWPLGLNLSSSGRENIVSDNSKCIYYIQWG